MLTAIGKQGAITNAVKTVWKGVKQDATDELVGIERHYLLTPACSITCKPPVGRGIQALVRT
jgi:hypothetical protein